MYYQDLINVYEKISLTSKRLEKVAILSEFISKLNENEISNVMLLLKGRVYEDWNRKELGMSSKLVLKAVNIASGISVDNIIKKWKEQGDLGITAMIILSKNQQKTLFKSQLSVKEVVNELRKISDFSGMGSSDLKIKILSRLLSNAEGIEIKYIVRTVLEDLRTGANEGVIRDAINLAFLNNDENSIKILQNAIDLTSDLSYVTLIAKKGINELKKIQPILYKPLKLMLFPKASSFSEIFKSLGDNCAFEFKYDGFRVQIHKGNKGIKVYTRRLDEVTEQFPDIVDYVKNNVKGNNFIIDCEVIGYDNLTGNYLPFQSISQRIKRKYNILEISKKFPIEIIVFDILFYDNKSYFNIEFKKRRKLLNLIINQFPKKICLSEILITNNQDEASNFYNEALKKGFEGIIAKSLDSFYIPGRKIGAGFKLKPVMQELDLVVTKAEWGTGKRSRWLTSFTLSCIDNDGNLLDIGKVSSGLKEVNSEDLTYSKMTEQLLPLIINEKGKEVILKPEIILEVNFEEIQKSSIYSSGYSLRFPRIIRQRDDKGLDEVSDIDQIDDFYNKQKGKG
jgi:DNA ligase 1